MHRFVKSQKRKAALPVLVIFALALNLISCASTGPKISKEDQKRIEEEFETKFLRASVGWLDRVYRVAYRLLRSPVPGHTNKEPKYGFVGVGVDDLKEYARKTNNIDKDIRGVLVRGIYPDSEAEGVDVKAGDVIVDGSSNGIRLQTPHFVQQFIAADDVAFAGDKEPEKIELFPCHLHWFPATAGGVPVEVHFNLPELQSGGTLARRRRPPQ